MLEAEWTDKSGSHIEGVSYVGPMGDGENNELYVYAGYPGNWLSVGILDAVHFDERPLPVDVANWLRITAKQWLG